MHAGEYKAMLLLVQVVVTVQNRVPACTELLQFMKEVALGPTLVLAFQMM